ncbi:MAG: hypothetical protein KDC12_06195 [Flavobacteriales bacterium]|nr:hypothetical protein [Flavobacteriales bacterium]
MRTLFLTLALSFTALLAQSQNVVINLDGAPGDNSAILDVQSTTSGILVPRMTTTEKTAIVSPATGLLVFDTDLQQFSYFDGTWKLIQTPVQVLSLSGQELSISDGNTVTLPGSGSGDMIQDTDGNTVVTTHATANSDEVSIFLGNELQSTYTFTTQNLSFDLPAQPAMAVGNDAGASITGGALNTFIGNRASSEMTTGSYNSILGYEAGKSLQGNSNTIVGTQAGFDLDGSGNTLMGDYIAPSMTNGDNNVMIGVNAGSSMASGNGNVFIGANTGASGSVNNRLYINNTAGGSPLIYGEFDNNLVAINGKLEATDGLLLGNTTSPEPGLMRYNSGSFEGYNGSAWIPLDNLASSAAFTETAGVVHNTGDLDNDDFVFGSNSLDLNISELNFNRFFFDKSLGAFRAGGTISTVWDQGQIGAYSFATNGETLANGGYSFAANFSSEASGSNSSAFGSYTRAYSYSSFALGAHNIGLNASSTVHNNQNTVLEVGIGSNGSRANALTIFRDGKVVVGGGTGLTYASLNPDYLFAVDGKLICEEIRVADSGNWPDYVFESEYELPHLTDVKAFIKQNGHLPGVPSAATVNGKGFEIGEMNEILLQKIEELTLYVIALQEEVNALKQNQEGHEEK